MGRFDSCQLIIRGVLFILTEVLEGGGVEAGSGGSRRFFRETTRNSFRL